MAVITFPTNGLAGVEWTVPSRANYLVRSAYSRTRTVVDRGSWFNGFKGVCTIAARSDADVRAWRVFLMQAQNLANTFDVPAVKPGEQSSVTPATVKARADNVKGDVQFNTDGWGRSGVETVMSAGMMISHAGALHILTADLETTSGTPDRALMNILPPLVANPVDEAVVQVRDPVAHCRLTSIGGGWEQLLSHYQPLSFEVEEAV